MLILTEAQVRRLLSMERCIAANRAALSSIRRKKEGNSWKGCACPVESPAAVVPTRIALPRRREDDDSDGNAPPDMTLFKPAALYAPHSSHQDGGRTIMGMKVVSVRDSNPAIGKPSTPATISMLNPETGEVSAIMGATYLTAARTAAGSAIATKLCFESKQKLDSNFQNDQAHQAPMNMIVFGAGIQAQLHIQAINHILPNHVRKLTIVNRTRHRAEKLKKFLLDDCSTEERDMHTTCNLEIDILVLTEMEQNGTDALKHSVKNANIIVMATNNPKPLFDWNWVDAKSVSGMCHINGVGSYLPSSSEVDPGFVREKCLTIVDTMDSLNVGDLKNINESSDNFVGTLGDALATGGIYSNINGMCTFFKSTGTAIQDIMTADEVIKMAKEQNVGINIEM